MPWSTEVPPPPVKPAVTGWWVVIVSNVAAQLQKLQANIVGEVPILGGLSPSMKKLQASLVGVEHPQGALSPAVKKLVASLVGEQRQTGTLAVTSQKLAAALVGAMFPQGTMSAQMRALTVSLVGEQIYLGAVAASVGKMSANLNGEVANFGAVAASLPAMSAELQGDMPPSGLIVAQMKPLSAALTGAQEQSGVIGAAMTPLSSSLNGEQRQQGSVGAVLGQLSVNVSGAQEQSGVMAAQLQKLSDSLSGVMHPEGVIGASLGLATAALAGGQMQQGAISASLGKASALLAGSQMQQGALAASLAKAIAALAGSVVAGENVEFDSIGGGDVGNFDKSTLTHTHEIGSATVVLGFIPATSVPTVGPTFGGEAMEYMGIVDGGMDMYVYKLMDPTPGANTASVSFAFANASIFQTIAYRNVFYVGLLDSLIGSSANASHAMTVQRTGQMLVHAFTTLNVAMSSPTGGTTRYNQANYAPLIIQESDTSTTFAVTNSSTQWSAGGVLLSNVSLGVQYVTSVQESEGFSRNISINFAGYVPKTDDVVVVFDKINAVVAMTTPTDWVNCHPSGGNSVVGSDTHTALAMYHKVTSAEQAAGTTTYGATNVWNTANSHFACGIVLRGVDPAAVIDSVAVGFDSANSATPTVLPALVGANLSNDSFVVGYVSAQGNGTWTPPAGWTERQDNQGGAIYTHNTLTVAGTNVAATNVTPSAGDENACFTIAFTADI